MDPNRLTQKTQEALQDAVTRAQRMGHTEIGPEHMLLALMEQRDGLVPRLLERLDVAFEPLHDALERRLSQRPRVSGTGAGGQVGLSRELNLMLDNAQRE